MRQNRAFAFGLTAASLIVSFGMIGFGCAADTVTQSSTGNHCNPVDEVCDGLDNNCDGEVDEGCDCMPDATQGCYSGPEGTSGKGLCKGGVQTCDADGHWGACSGQVLPTDADSCDGVDNNCDGMVDEGCACSPPVPETTQPCYTGDTGTEGVGACHGGTQSCKPDGTWDKKCVGEVKPSTEICDLIDNDCNGQVDELGMTTCGVGACQVTVVACENGVENPCIPLNPSKEVCDGVDNDCDQLTDESDAQIGKACTSSAQGICQPGTLSCMGGSLTCVSTLSPLPESCDGLDNDCDGVVDNNIPGTGGPCSSGYPGICDQGAISCQNGIIDCYPVVPPSDEICDGIDNDCDNLIDENNPGGNVPCDTGALGICQAGTLNCISGALQCTPNKSASAETCDGLDNNCDGQVDEGSPGAGVACGCGGTTACTNGAIVCNGGPTTYFYEEFKDNSKGWTLGTTGQIGPAVGGCAGCTGNPDPATDHTATADNGLAGVIIGGPAPTSLHDFYYIESPPFDTSTAPGPVYLQFWRWLNSDYFSFMQNKIQVWNGSAWIDLPYGTTGGCCGVMDAAWMNHGLPVGAPAQPTSSAEYPTQFDITAYKNAQMRVRFGYNIASSGVYTIGSWSIDDVLVASALCP